MIDFAMQCEYDMNRDYGKIVKENSQQFMQFFDTPSWE